MTKAPQAIADNDDVVSVAEPAGEAVPVEAAPRRRGRPPGSGKNGNAAPRKPRQAASSEHTVITGTTSVRVQIETVTASGRMVLDRQIASKGDIHDEVSNALRACFQDWWTAASK